MIVDSMIDESTAKYKCMFAGFDFKRAEEEFDKAKESKSDSKKAVQLAVGIASKKKSMSEGKKWLDEGFFSSIYDFIMKSPPAWVDEPTGFNDPRPEAVFRDDVKGGIEGYNKGAAAAIVTAALVLSRKAIPKIANAAIKHPVAAGVAAVAATHPGKMANVADTAIEATKKAAKAVEDNKDLIGKIADFFKPVVDFVAAHPGLASIAGASCYALLQTYPLWWPYMKRLNYELTSGNVVAACEFEANDQSWRFEYSLEKGRWILLSRGKIASQSDSISFSQTTFAKKFINRCREILETVFDNQKYISIASTIASKDASQNMIAEVLDNRAKIESTMFTGKILA